MVVSIICCIFVLGNKNNTIMKLEEIHQRINELAKEMDMLEETLQEAMVSSIYEITKENHYGAKKIGNHMMSISASQMVGRPWSPKFYDWEDSAKSILNYLSETPAINWKKKLTELLEVKGDIIELKRKGIIIDKVFIEKIIEKI